MAEGLGGPSSVPNWSGSKKGVVYLAHDKDVAISYAETSDDVPEHFLDQIVVLEIDATKLEASNIYSDNNVIDDDSTVEYHSIVEPRAITEVVPQFEMSVHSTSSPKVSL